jgi:hypothetical protein|tara:strand:+ start:453 stop:704 length:252 start_codon:yes stop_codon:yes gene_type:complete
MSEKKAVMQLNTNLTINFEYDGMWEDEEVMEVFYEAIRGRPDITLTLMTDLGYYFQAKVTERMEKLGITIDVKNHKIHLKKEK